MQANIHHERNLKGMRNILVIQNLSENLGTHLHGQSQIEIETGIGDVVDLTPDLDLTDLLEQVHPIQDQTGRIDTSLTEGTIGTHHIKRGLDILVLMETVRQKIAQIQKMITAEPIPRLAIQSVHLDPHIIESPGLHLIQNLTGIVNHNPLPLILILRKKKCPP